MRRILLIVAGLALSCPSMALLCPDAQAFRPYRAMVSAAEDERPVSDMRQDKLAGKEVNHALSRAQGLDGADIKGYVFMEKAFLVGTVREPEQPEIARAAARGVEGIRSVDTYLPEILRNESSSRSDMAIDTMVKAALLADPELVATRYTAHTVQGAVVLMGVAGSAEQRDKAVAAAKGVDGVTQVVDFVLLPEAEYQKRVRERIGILR